MHSQKIHNKKLILPVLIFLAGCLALAAVLYHSYRTNLKQVRAVTELNATTYAERLQNDMNRGVAITDTLEEIVLSENGKPCRVRSRNARLRSPRRSLSALR